jgi:hypothetical protein
MENDLFENSFGFSINNNKNVFLVFLFSPLSLLADTEKQYVKKDLFVLVINILYQHNRKSHSCENC